MTQLLLTFVTSRLHKKISFYYQVSLEYSIRLVHVPVRKTIDLSNLASQQALIRLMILTIKANTLNDQSEYSCLSGFMKTVLEFNVYRAKVFAKI